MSYTAAISVIASNLRESDNNRRDVVVAGRDRFDLIHSRCSCRLFRCN